MKLVKLQKALLDAGLFSRRNLRKMIHLGQFKINGKVVTDPAFEFNPIKDTLLFNEKVVKLKKEKKVYYLFNKPDNVVSTMDDPQKRPSVKDFTTGIRERVYPVGRLDFHSEGLLLLTNDGSLTNFIISAKNKIPKIYMVKIKGVLEKEKKAKLVTKGIFLDDVRIKNIFIDYLKKTGNNNSWLRVTIFEGKKHILRKIFRYSGHPVQKLKRIAIGNFKLKSLPAGHIRRVTEEELSWFKKKYRFSDDT